MKQINIKYILLISALILFHFLSNYIWCSNDWLTTEDDMSDHLVKHFMFYSDINRLFSAPLGLISKITGMFNLTGRYSTFAYPPLVYSVSSVISVVFHNPGILIARLSNMLYFSVLIISVYLTGRACVSRSFGFIAAALVSFYPAVAGVSRLYGLDFALTAFTVFAVYCLIRAEYFTKTKESIFFGFALGLGLLAKGQILFFIIGPFFYAAIKGLAYKRGNGSPGLSPGDVAKNVIASVSIAGFISSIWWLPHFKTIIHKFSEQVFVSYIGPQCPEWVGGLMKLKPFSLDWALAYSYFLLNDITPALFILFLSGLVVFFKINMKHKGIIFSWAAASYILLTIFSVKKDRFFLPALPAIALISTLFFYSIKNKKLQRTVVFTVMTFAFAQFIFLSHSEKSSGLYWCADKNSMFYIMTPMNSIGVYGSEDPKGNFYESICIQPHRCNVESVALGLFKKIDKDALKKEIRVGMSGYNLIWNLDFSIRYIWKSKNMDIQFYKIGKDRHFPFGKDDYSITGYIVYDYIIALKDKSGLKPFPEGAVPGEIMDDFSNFGLADRDGYVLIDTRTVLPDNYAVFLFKRR